MGGLGAGGASLFDGCSGFDFDGGILGVLAVAFFVFFALWFLGRWIADRLQQR